MWGRGDAEKGKIDRYGDRVSEGASGGVGTEWDITPENDVGTRGRGKLIGKEIGRCVSWQISARLRSYGFGKMR